MFQNVDAFAGDPILSLMDEFNKDPRENKINLSIGLYYDGKGNTPQLGTVGKAKTKLNQVPAIASLYLPMEGLHNYRLAIQKLLFGADNPLINEQRIATVQTIGGSGALKLGADFYIVIFLLQRSGVVIRHGKIMLLFLWDQVLMSIITPILMPKLKG